MTKSISIMILAGCLAVPATAQDLVRAGSVESFPATVVVSDGTGRTVTIPPVVLVDPATGAPYRASGGSGGGGGDASAANQLTQIAREASIRDQIGALASPATGSSNYWLSAINTRLGSPMQAGGSIGNTAFGISGTLPAFAATPTFNLGTSPAVGSSGSAAPAGVSQQGGRTAAGNLVALCTSTNGALCAPVADASQSTGTVTALAANTSATICPATSNPVTFEVQIYGAGPVLLGLDGQALTAVTPAAGSGAFILLPTQYALYVGPVARTNAITAFTATAQTVVCNIVTRS